jgi:hypothetical protein
MVIVERAIVVAVRIKAESIEEADKAFADLGMRIRFSLPKLRFGPVRIKWRRVDIHEITRTSKAWRVGRYLATVNEEGTT